MKHALKFESISANEQKALAMLICNLFSNPQTSSYALYFSEWENSSNLDEKCSNAQIVVDLAKICLESHSPILNQYGSGKYMLIFVFFFYVQKKKITSF